MDALTFEQQEIYNHIFEKIEIQEPISVCILGAPGTGKTSLLLKIIEDLKNKDLNVFPLSHTGIAASSIYGTTIHSFFKFNINEHPYNSASVVIDDRKVTINNLSTDPKSHSELTGVSGLHETNINNVLIIDEISSCGINLIVAIDKTLRHIFNTLDPFGGVHIILTGDMLQLDPVSDIPLWRVQHFPYKWDLFELEESLRNNQELYTICNKIRDGKISTISEIITREEAPFDKNTIYLFTHRRDAYSFNQKAYSELIEDCNYTDTNILYLENGMRVLFLTKKGNVSNGTIGYIINVDKKHVTIKTPYGSVIVNRGDIGIERENYKPDITICFGSTIHKLQGQTLDKVCVRIRYIFEYGLVNVLLTRVRSLDMLRVEDISDNGNIYGRSTLIDYELKRRYVEAFKRRLGSRSEEAEKPIFFSFSKVR